MNHKLIKVAIEKPYAYPWNEGKFIAFDKEEMDELLEKYNLRSQADRRRAGWKIKFTILKSVKICLSK